MGIGTDILILHLVNIVLRSSHICLSKRRGGALKGDVKPMITLHDGMFEFLTELAHGTVVPGIRA
jgi:hypothetical protein